MKLLIASGIYPPEIGGPAKYAETLMKELPRRGISVAVIAYGSARDDSPAGVYRVARTWPPLFRHLFYALKVWQVGREAQAILALDTVSAGAPAVLANCFLRKRLIFKVVGDYAWEQAQVKRLTVDSLDDFQHKKYGWRVEILRRAQRWAVSRADAVFTPSNYLAGIVKGWGAKDARVVYNAVSIPEAAAVSAPRFPSKDVILSVGRLVPWKGFAALIEIMPRLLQENPKFHLVILGDGPERPRLEKLISELNLSSAVMLAGARAHEEVAGYLREAKVFVLNSGYEGLAHVLLEAMSVGTPVAASLVGGNRELLQPTLKYRNIEISRTGLGFSYNNRDEIEKAILELTRNETLRQECLRGAKELMKEFTIPRMVDGAASLIFPERDASRARVLLVSLDNTVTDSDSPSLRRMQAYARKIGHLSILVLSKGKPFKSPNSGTNLSIECFGGKNKSGTLKRAFFELKKLVAEARPDIAVAQDPFFTGFLARRAARFAHARLLVELHGDFWPEDKKLHPYFWRNFIAGRVLRRADAVRVVSDKVKKGLLAKFPNLKAKRMDVFPIVSGEINPWPFLNKVRGGITGEYHEDAITALFVGRLTKEKGLDWFFPVFARVIIGSPLRLYLRVVGNGPETEALKQLVKKLGIDSKVYFVGEVAEPLLDNEYGTADFLVLPSRQESWGRVVVEAMQSGCPVITTSEVGVAHDILKNGENALVVPFGDNEAMEQALQKMATDDELRKRLGMAGKVSVADLSFDKMVDKMQNLWKSA